jgi:signal transduction histidine kinase
LIAGSCAVAYVPAVTAPDLATVLAARLRESRAHITGRWLERIAARVTVSVENIFPTDDLLDHMPLLVAGIADYLEDPTDVIPADAVVVHHARELGALRHMQGFNEYEILKEFEILGGVLFSFAMETAAEIDADADHGAALACASRLFQSIALVQQATTSRFLELAKTRVAEREGRLRAFHRALTHEMRNRIGATLGAGQLLQIPDIDPSQRDQLAGVIVRNADSMRLVMENLLELARIDGDTRQQRHVLLRSAVAESARQLRDMAATQFVDVRIQDDMPAVEVNAAVLELTLANLLSNAIKYSDPAKSTRWASVEARLIETPDGAPMELVVAVQDNGIGISAQGREQLFRRFFRAHMESNPSVEGTGLGLNLVRETLDGIGGRVWVEDTAEGMRVAFSIPCRRTLDVPADISPDVARGPVTFGHGIPHPSPPPR